jgi:hypothetical protein
MVSYEFTAGLRTYGRNKDGVTTLTLKTDLLSSTIGKRLVLQRKAIHVRITFIDDKEQGLWNLDDVLVLNRGDKQLGVPQEVFDK